MEQYFLVTQKYASKDLKMECKYMEYKTKQ